MSSNGSKIRLGQYNILKTIGTGSFGKVKLAVHATTGQKVALKIINRKKIASMNMSGRVKREIQYLKLLRHPHIIKLYEVIATPTDIIMVIEYAGGELFNYIVEKGKMSEDDARRFFQQIICAVEYCHRHKIVHRDLKPENLLLDANNNVKIADFGLSNIMTDGDFLKTSCGSPNYAAPEVISGKLYAGPEVDVWSCGVILYVMLCGRLPFDDEYIPTLFKKINGGIYTMPSFISPETKYLLTSMLVVDPMKRITIQEIRQNPWFNINLPDYLRPLPETEEGLNHPVSDSIVSELAKKMGYSEQKIYKSLSSPGNNQFKVAYQLVVDHKRMLQDSELGNVQSFFATSPPPWNTTFFQDDTDASYNNSVDDMASSISVLSSSIPKSEEQDRGRSSFPPPRASLGSSGQPIAPIVGTPPPGAMAPSPYEAPRPQRHLSAAQQQPLRRSHKSRMRWHFGIRSKCPVWEVMLEIYRSLQNVGMKWKTIDPYHVRCLYRYPELGLDVKFDLQVYKLDNNSFLVDFKSTGTEKGAAVLSAKDAAEMIQHKLEDNMTGLRLGETPWDGYDDKENITSVYPFLDVCSRLITDIV
ncbi:kinase-like domain-containing protein [Syncephalastrum racemosum]|uniref:non-specific serine/threonine protein kinase n=1 Tax=Syncephalastrum racemosum TaxID=13706 RepID=A0A1X2HME7_SYNRA|nr:kinase-like domain-containing protein [Syncephalastrum racemosum]